VGDETTVLARKANTQAKMSRTLLIALALAASPAFALDAGKPGQGGSLPLSDLDHLIGQSAQLRDEVNAALAKINKRAEDIVCLGNLFPSEWIHFGGARVAPYNCNFDGQWLTIDAEVHVSGPDGRIYDKITPAAMQNAVKVIETNPAWRWSAHPPSLE
jgi:hypothetical protein